MKSLGSFFKGLAGGGVNTFFHFLNNMLDRHEEQKGFPSIQC
jgi:hypothetical protein